MSARRTGMHRLQRLVRLNREGLSLRQACENLGMGRNTARRYRDALAGEALWDGPVDELPELEELKAAIAKHAPVKRGPQAVSSVLRWADDIERMADNGAGPRAIFDALRLNDEEFNGSYAAVKRFCRSRKKKRPPDPGQVAIPVTTRPGEVAQVDFFFVGKVFDPKQRRDRRCWAFVMLLAHSRHMFVELVFDQRVETWQRLHVQAFSFFGAVPEVVVPDNLKAAVIRAAFNSSDDIALNRSYAELARYYRFRIDPTPAYAPKKKGKVERAGKYFRDNFIRPRLGQDIHELRAGVGPWLAEIAGKRRHGTTGRAPIEVFEVEELPAMRACPRMPFGEVIWHQAKVHADSHLHFRTRVYSVPWALLGKVVWVRATHESVVVYADDERVATHVRSDVRGRSTLPGHLPPRREQWGHQSRVYWEELAGRLGDEVFTYVLELFDDEDALLPLRKVQAIVSFLQDYPSERRDAACRRARFFGVTSVRAFKDILRKNLDQQPLPDTVVRVFGELDAPRFARTPPLFTSTTPEA